MHRAFAEHRPLTLSPDHIWLTIARGFADHVDEHAEALRGRFVRHDGQAPLVVQVTGRLQAQAQWREAVDRFSAGIADCICGIPRITLEGFVDDWREIRRRIDVLAEYDLQWWASALRPVCDALVETAAGRPGPDFWRSIYKPEEAYGGDVATGWLMRLFPYHQDRDGRRSRSHIFANDHLHRPSATNLWICAGVSPSSPAAGLRMMAPDLVAGEISSKLMRGVDRRPTALANETAQGPTTTAARKKRRNPCCD